MATKNNIFEDFARVSSSVASVAFESVKNMQDSAKARVNSLAKSADLVTRDEFEAFKTIATKARLDSESLAKEFAEIKKQMQTLTSSFDVIKEQISKNINPGSPSSLSEENNQKLLSELQVFGENVEARLNEFGVTMDKQWQKIEEINSKFDFAKSEKSQAKAKKNVNMNPTLFDDEQN